MITLNLKRSATALVVIAGAMVATACVGTHEPSFADGTSSLQRGDAQFAQGKYREAFDSYNAAATALDGKDARLFGEAVTRSAKAFCLLQFTRARDDLAQGNLPLAFMEIDTALLEPACGQFPEEIQWAQEQRRRISAPVPAK